LVTEQPATTHSSQDHLALLPSLATSTVLELGSGTGFLGIALRDVVSPTLETLAAPLPPPPPRGSGSRANCAPRAASFPPCRSWCAICARTGSSRRRRRKRRCQSLEGRGVVHLQSSSSSLQSVSLSLLLAVPLDSFSEPIQLEHFDADDDDELEGPLVLLAVDCIYNPSLSAPLAKTLLRQASRTPRALPRPSIRSPRQSRCPDRWLLPSLMHADGLYCARGVLEELDGGDAEEGGGGGGVDHC
jgi:hypothetical protein